MAAPILTGSTLKRNEVKTDSKAKICGRRTHELQSDHLGGYCGARSWGKTMDDRIGHSDGFCSNGSPKIEGPYRHTLEGHASKRSAWQALKQIVAWVNHWTCVRDADEGQNCGKSGGLSYSQYSPELHCNLLVVTG